MPIPPLYPLTFREIYQDYIWGGTNLTKIGKQIETGRKIAESWEISDMDNNVSVVRDGPLAGKTLRELVAIYGEDISPKTANGRFPVLIKYLDVQRRASLQLHGDDDFARAHEGPDKCGKHESWYVMDADSETQAVLGLKRGVTRKMLEEAVGGQRIESLLNTVSIAVGDFVDVRPGTLHCLLEGTLICEIQQTSDNLYRFYDWGRLGQDGKPRSLHVEKALAAVRLPVPEDDDPCSHGAVVRPDPSVIDKPVVLRRGREYNVDYLRLGKDFALSLEGCHFHALNIVQGSGVLSTSRGEFPFQIGNTILVPRSVETYTVVTNGCEILNTFL